MIDVGMTRALGTKVAVSAKRLELLECGLQCVGTQHVKVLERPTGEDFARDFYCPVGIAVNVEAASEGRVPAGLLVVFRAVELNDQDVKMADHMEAIKARFAMGEPVHSNNEFRALAALREFLDMSLAAVPELESWQSDVSRLVDDEFLKVCESLAAFTRGKLAPDDLATIQSGSPWVTTLVESAGRMEALGEEAADLTRKLGLILPRRLAVQATMIPYLWMLDKLRHPCACFAMHAPHCWPKSWEAPVMTQAIHRAGQLDDAELDPENPEQNALLALYSEKCLMWGCWFTAQWTVGGMFSVTDLNLIAKERVMIGQNWAWSVPSNAALKILADESNRPGCSGLVELGAGNGYWASVLLSRGVDIVAYDTPTWKSEFNPEHAAVAGKTDGEKLIGDKIYSSIITEGGPQAVSLHADRALILMWPDYGGVGTYGSACVRRFAGETLITVGEWGSETLHATLGAYASGLPSTGQSFSQECQEMVESRFELVNVCRLPNFPLFCDVLAVWRRRPKKQKK